MFDTIISDSLELTAIRILLRNLINKPTDKTDSLILNILSDAKKLCTDKSNIEILRTINRSTYTYATLIGREVNIDWFESFKNINSLTSDDYQKILDFFDIYEFNKQHALEYMHKSDNAVYKYVSNIDFNGEDLVSLKIVKSDNADVKPYIAVTHEDFENNYISLKKQY